MAPGKYVPPALRGRGDGPSSRSSSRDGRGGDSRDGYDRAALQPTNDRWNTKDNRGYGSRGDGYGQRDGGSRGRDDFYSGGRDGGRPGRRGGSGRGPRRNELGFFGDLRPDPRLEARLFNREEAQQTGINFDKVLHALAITKTINDCALY